MARVEALKAADPANTKPIPVDLVTASGSGLDPYISPARRNIRLHVSPECVICMLLKCMNWLTVTQKGGDSAF